MLAPSLNSMPHAFNTITNLMPESMEINKNIERHSTKSDYLFRVNTEYIFFFYFVATICCRFLFSSYFFFEQQEQQQKKNAQSTLNRGYIIIINIQWHSITYPVWSDCRTIRPAHRHSISKQWKQRNVEKNKHNYYDYCYFRKYFE